MTAFLDAWRRQHPRAFRLGFWYVLGAVSLTALWLAALGVAPDPGLTRSYWHPIEGETESVVEERVTAIDLEFIDEQDRSTRDYRVRWEGVWFSPQAERVDFHAGADDHVILRVDGEVVLERNPAVGMHTVARTVDLEAGAHRLQVDYWQDGGAAYLNVQGAPAGGAPGLLSPARLFAEDPGALGYWLRVAAARLPVLVLLVWTTGVAVLVLVAAGRAIYRRVTNLGVDELWRRLRTVLFPAFLGPSQILLFGPWTVHDTNRTEFLVGFWELAPGWVWLLAPITGTLVAVGLVLPARWFSRYAATLCAAGVLIWAQGNLLLANYGLLDGGALDLASHEWRTPYEAALWVGVLVLAVVFADVVMRAAPVTSVALVALQATVLVLPVSRVATLDTPPTRATETEWRLPPPEIFELSSTRNIIHIVLDTFPTHTFADILDGDGSSFDRDWSGFTFFANHLGTHRTTLISLPAMLSGVSFGNDMPFPEFVAQHPTVFNTLGQQGYQLRSLNAYVDVPGVDAAIQYEVPTPYGSYRDYVDVTAARLLDLSLFRHAPHGFKPAVYGDARWFLQQRIESGPWLEAMAAKPFGNTVFLREFADRIIQGDDAPVYLFLQAYTPHLPIVTDADCEYAPSRTPDPERFADQARCALSAVRMLLQRLRDLDLYDRSAIIVSSDHGIDLAYIEPEEEHPLGGIRSPAGETLARVEAYATPLLLVKPFAAQGPLETSFAPTSVVDVSATVLDFAGLSDTLGRGTSVVGIDPAAPRERVYGHHDRVDPSPFFDVLHMFAVNGWATDPNAWSHYRSVFGPTDDRVAQRREHQVGLSAVPDESATESGARIYGADRYAVFYLAPENPRVTFDVRRMPGMTASQTVTVRIDGQVVDRHVLVDDAWHTLSYPVTARSEESPFCIELRTSPGWYDETGESWGPMLRGAI